ncbi:GGDEF domain-containing protein [Cellulomonas bogoriensis]|nr:GGDEF domain-containing protein [Cellulomonas bogoriensis]
MPPVEDQVRDDAAATAPDWAVLLEDLELLVDSDAASCARRADEGIALAQVRGDRDAEMRLTYYAAVARHLLGDDRRSLELAQHAEELADHRGDLVWQSRSLACRGLVHHDLGDVEDAVDLLTRAVDLGREAGDITGTAEILNSLGTVYTGMVQFAPQAAQVLTEARRLWLQAGDPDRASIALTNLAKTYVVTSGRLAETNPRGALTAARHALGIAHQAVDEADAAGLSRTAVDARLAVVGAHMVAGDLPAAGKVLQATRAMLVRFPAPRQLLALHRVRGRWLVRCGEPLEAVEVLTEGLRLCDELDRPGERPELLRTLVTAHEDLDQTVEALERLHELYELTIRRNQAVAERRAELLSSRLEVERAERVAEAERKRAAALEQHNARLAHEASHDALTGLANRRSLDQTLARWTEAHPRDFAVALLDIDHFKHVNDTYSHQVGDEVLARIGAELRGTLRTGDVPARYGGEEFALLLDGVQALGAMETCERVRQAIAALEWGDLIGGEHVTVSLGVATGGAGTDAGELLSRADAALYQAKRAGRNQVRLAE